MRMLYMFLGFLASLALFVIVVFIGNRSATKKIGSLRERGMYPKEGKETDQDVLRLGGVAAGPGG